MSLFNKLLATYDYMRGRFECVEAKGDLYKKCLEVRKTVFGDELKREQDSRLSPALEDEYDPLSIHLACMDTRSGNIVGSIRITPAVQMSSSAEMKAEYHLELFPSDMLPHIFVVTRLAVLKEYRKSPAALLLAEKCFELGVGKLRPTYISVIVCEPNLYPMYRRLGFKPLGRVQNSVFGGYRLPLYMISHDYHHLQKQGSPFYKIAKKLEFPILEDGIRWEQEMNLKNELFDPGFIFLEENYTSSENMLTAGLSLSGKKEVYHHAIVICCGTGEKIVAQGGGERTVGIVKKGMVEIRRKNQKVALLAEGDFFGEIAFILDIPRTADVFAAMPDTKVILLSLSMMNRLSSVEDRVRIWQNLARVCAYRLSQY